MPIKVIYWTELLKKKYLDKYVVNLNYFLIHLKPKMENNFWTEF
jgi:hypothetical protein